MKKNPFGLAYEPSSIMTETSSTSRRSQLMWLWLSVFILIIDQASKIFITKLFADQAIIEVFPFLNLVLSHNAGAAFGFLHSADGWQRWLFIGIALIISGFVIHWLYHGRGSRWTACAVALILGGAIGNLYDRIAYEYVIDFIDVHIGSWHYATFNIADSAICVGAAMWILEIFKSSRKK